MINKEEEGITNKDGFVVEDYHLPLSTQDMKELRTTLLRVPKKDKEKYRDSIHFIEEEHIKNSPEDDRFIKTWKGYNFESFPNDEVEDSDKEINLKKTLEEIPQELWGYSEEQLKEYLSFSEKAGVSNAEISIFTKWILKKYDIKPHFGERGIINIELKSDDGEFENWDLELRKMTSRIFGVRYNEQVTQRVFSKLIASHKALSREELLKEKGEFEDEFVISTSKEISESEFDRKFIVDNFIHEGSVNVLYSPPANYKTFISQSMALCVATGKEWLGRKTTKSNVLVWDLENPKFVIKERQTALKNGLDIEEPVEGLFYLNGGMLMDREKTINLSLLRKVKKFIKENNIKLIDVDTMHRLANYDENSANDFNAFYTGILKPIARDLNCAFLLLHHSNKNGDYRGSSDIEGAVECMFEMKKIKEEGLFEIKSKKFRFGKEQQIKGKITFNEDSITISQSDFNTPEEEKESEKIEALEVMKNLFVRDKELKRVEIIERISELEISDAYVDKILKQLVNQKFLEKQGKGVYKVNTNHSSYKYLINTQLKPDLLTLLKNNSHRIVSLEEIKRNIDEPETELDKLKQEGVIDEVKPNHYQFL